MTYTIILFLTRNPRISSEEFRDYYEQIHIPKAHDLVSRSGWPQEFRRRYFARITRKGFGGPANPDRPTLMLRGERNELDCDCIGEMNFTDERSFREFYKAIYEKENAAILAQSEDKFLDTGKTRVVVVGETWTTDVNGVTKCEEVGSIPNMEGSESEDGVGSEQS
jgi:hypothetical protein